MKAETELNIGEDGRAYYHFNAGERYRIRPPHAEQFIYEVVDMEYENGKEYYYLSVNGRVLETRYSLAELSLLLARFESELLDEGESIELPLLNEEVIRFYDDKKKHMRFQNAEANKILKQTQYFVLQNAKYNQERRMRLAIAERNDDEAEAAKKQIAKIDAEMNKILAEKKIDYKVLHKVKECTVCNDAGIVDGKICECAQARYEQIKDYAAMVRLAERSR